jgi:hypothetical protein
MPDLSYPFVYECSGCEAEITVSREDARGLYPDPDSFNAVEVVLQERGWMRGEQDEMLFCPDCAGPEGADDDMPTIYI